MTKSIDMANEAQLSHVLGVDFGLSKIGLAIADEETKMAFAFDILKNDKQLFDNLRDILIEKNIKKVVLGMTKHEKDSDSFMEKENFAKRLKEELSVHVFLQEEMFTTKMAHANIKLHGKKNISATDDKEAARIILQSWLDGE
ncbi:MAG: hypothetical protein ACD_5C00336G0001 [uncultured bacterium]|nr:MAG: hypothetical protein ACD_5C00336G0001 [uncultured bacterium]